MAEYYAVTWLWDNGYEVFKNCGCTGAIDLIGCPVNAEFVYTAAHSSGFSGKIVTGDAGNAIVEILVNTPSQKRNATVKLSTW